jgi:tetratricopeptide (TPR) repeat protein
VDRPAAQTPPSSGAEHHEAAYEYEGLAASEEAVSVYRRLAAASPAAYEPDLASSLNNLSVRLTEAGRREEAEGVRREAAEIERRLMPPDRATNER